MKNIKILPLSMRAFLLMLIVLLTANAGATPKVGDSAPEFELSGTDGKMHRLADYLGKSWVVLAWYPRAFTPACTTQCSAIQGKEELFKLKSVKVFGASIDSVEQNASFAKKFGPQFVLLSDPDRKAAKAYGVMHSILPMTSRTTFIIDKKGIIRDMIQDVEVATAGEQILERLRKLKVIQAAPQDSAIQLWPRSLTD